MAITVLWPPVFEVAGFMSWQLNVDIYCRIRISPPEDAWQDLSFQFNWNIPSDLENEAQTAQTLMGVVSHETAMKPLSVVDDPATEMEKIRDEQAETIRNAVRNSPSLTDQDKASDDDGEE